MRGNCARSQGHRLSARGSLDSSAFTQQYGWSRRGRAATQDFDSNHVPPFGAVPRESDAERALAGKSGIICKRRGGPRIGTPHQIPFGNAISADSAQTVASGFPDRAMLPKTSFLGNQMQSLLLHAARSKSNSSRASSDSRLVKLPLVSAGRCQFVMATVKTAFAEAPDDPD